jgi:hypothetical protein
MPTVIIAGLPADSDRRVQSALKQQAEFPNTWSVSWIRSKGRMPGLAPSQLEDVTQTAASYSGGAHLLVFGGQLKRDQATVNAELAPYFRLRWLDHAILKLIPHRMHDFFQIINTVLDEELKWIETVKPRDESSCLLLPECAFSAVSAVRHLWIAATQPGIERINLAAAACQRFKTMHWLPNTKRKNSPHTKNKNSPRGWIDAEDRIFDHRGPRHRVAPFPRSWKFSYQVVQGFHYDVESRDSRAFNVTGADGNRHSASGSGHINIDPHGYVLT